jgi:MurNAc alpha-1-phosphate uridylyltransferase
MSRPAAASFPDHAMVLAAGLGTRMRPLTETQPKPLVRVAGKALIDHVLDPLAQSGVATAVVNVHHFADQMEAHLASRPQPRRRARRHRSTPMSFRSRIPQQVTS